MKKTHKSIKVILGVLAMSALIFSFAGCNNGTPATGDGDSTGTEKSGVSDPAINGGNNGGNEEKPTAITSEKGLFSAVGTSEGLEITVSDKVRFLKDAGCVITVENTPFYISISSDDIDKGRVKWVFPFTEAGVEYKIVLKGNFYDDNDKIQWIEDPLQKCKALGGFDYSKIINTDKITNSTIDVAYSPDGFSDLFPEGLENNFLASYDIDITSIEDLILDKSKLKRADIDFVILLGKLNYANSKWYTSFKIDLLEDDINELLEYSKGLIPFGNNKPKDEIWSQFDYEYCSYVVPTFIFNQYPNTCFQINNIWSEQEKYSPNSESGVESEIVIFDPATTDYVTTGEIVEIDGTKYWKVTPNGYGTWINVSSIDCTGKTTFKATMFAEKDDDTIDLSIKLADSNFDYISLIAMRPITTEAKEYTAAHSEDEGWNTLSETDICSIIQPQVQNNSTWDALDNIVVYIGKITVE